MTVYENALKLHEQWRGKIEVANTVPLNTAEDLSVAYTPGVAEPCKEISKDKDKAFIYTRKWNLVAVVTDGTAVLGLGDIGPEAGMPVMEGKSVLFKKFGGVDAFPICLATKDTEEIIKTIINIAPTFGGINLEDISAPRCFEIERRLKEVLDIPVFHDDQHGTAVVTLAALYNALKIVDKKIEDILIVINGAGAAAIAITRLLIEAGAKKITLCDTKGAIYEGREGLNEVKKDIAKLTNKNNLKGSLKEIIGGADVFIGVSAPEVMNADMVKTMNKDAIIFAMANPVPEIYPDDAKLGGARVIGTGRSDFPNQINNVLVFPGIFRGALDVRAKDINNEMKIASAKAIAALISDSELSEDYVIPKPFDARVSQVVSEAVKEVARKTGVARI